MWEKAFELFEQADRLHRQIFQLGRPSTHLPTWEPPVDIFETETKYWIIVALPGVDLDRLEVTLDGRMLSIRGERSLPPEARQAVIHRLEIPYGHFERRIELPPDAVELERRELAQGCLVLTLKKQ